MKPFKPPFPWFGGKSRVAARVWQRLGNVQHYVEPFFGSGAILFARPDPIRTETVNDKDHWIANFWRAVQHAPEIVALHADNPVNEDDLTARHIHLVEYILPELAARIPADPEYYDAKAAGWWVWGICCWIGGGWCSGTGPWTEEDGQLVHLGGARRGVNRQLVHLGARRGVNRKLVHLGGARRGVNRQRVHLGDAGRGVNRKLVHLGGARRGVNRQRVHLGDAGRGVNRKLVHLGGAGQGVNRQRDLLDYIQSLSDRLRSVRVCCGDWQRVVTDGALSHGDPIGIFLDPPYSAKIRADTIYNFDTTGDDIPAAVRAWCIEHGSNKRYRIALCGYEGEHNELERLGWSKLAWKAGASYQQSNGGSQNEYNRKQERIWFSPACTGQKSYFDLEMP